MRTRFLPLFGFALTAAAVGQIELTEQATQVMSGERIDPRLYGAGYVETMEAAVARDAVRQQHAPTLEQVDAPKNGEWAIPSPGATEHPFSGVRYLANKHGATEMSIGFAELVDVHGLALSGQGNPVVWAQCLRISGYHGDELVAETDWLSDFGTPSQWYDLQFEGVDRIAFEAQPVYGGAAHFGIDDLTFASAGSPQATVLDFEDTNHKQALTDSGYGGLIWETGSLGFRSEPTIIPAPQDVALEGKKGSSNSGDDSFGLRGGSGTPPTLLSSFEGIRRGDSGQFSAPPDTHGAAGPTQFVAVVNTTFAIYNKSNGNELTNIALSSFLPGSSGDPRVLYDQYEDRWVVIVTDFNSRIYLAVSETSDATGSWFKTNFVVSTGADNGCWPDYPTLGVDEDGYYVTSFMVGCGMSIFAIEKAPLVAASQSLGAVTAFRGLPFEGAIQPCHTYGSAPGQYFISTRNNAQLALRLVSGAPTSPTLQDLGSFSVSFTEPPDAPAQGTSTPLDTVGSRLMNAVYRGGQIYTAHAVNANGRSACRWYELNANTLNITQSGTVNDPTLSYMFPAVAVNANGDIVMGLSGSSANTFASAYYTGRLASDPPGEMATPILLQAGQAGQNIIDSFGRNRFGDYSLTSLDPSDDATFWTIQEWVAQTDIWSTYIGHLETAPIPLNLELQTSVPRFVEPLTALDVTVQITPDNEGIQAGTETLHYRVDGGSFVTQTLTPLGGNLYQGTIPGANCGAQPEFYFSAQGTGGSVVVTPGGAPSNTFSYQLGTLTLVTADDFQTDQGWTVSATATAGVWERGTPVDCDRGDPPSDFDGSGQCYLTENDAGDCNSDVDGGRTRLLSPDFVLNGDDAVIRYARWFTTTDTDEEWVVEIQKNTQDFRDVERTTGGTANWIEREVVLSDLYTIPTGTFRMRFQARDADPGAVIEAGLDAFRVEIVTCDRGLPCPGDINDDGAIDLSDLAELLSQFGRSGAGFSADINEDGTVDLSDLAELLSVFGQACP